MLFLCVVDIVVVVLAVVSLSQKPSPQNPDAISTLSIQKQDNTKDEKYLCVRYIQLIYTAVYWGGGGVICLTYTYTACNNQYNYIQIYEQVRSYCKSDTMPLLTLYLKSKRGEPKKDKSGTYPERQWVKWRLP